MTETPSPMYYVEAYEIRSGNVLSRMGPMTERRADKVYDGLMININEEEYAGRIVLAEEALK